MKVVVLVCIISAFALSMPNIAHADDKPKQSVTHTEHPLAIGSQSSGPGAGKIAFNPFTSHQPAGIKGPSVHPTVNIHPTINTVRVR